jgi:uncharacterized protein with NRDE domain
MCTVTFIPRDTAYLITSNRDESNLRKPASFPAREKLGRVTCLFPRDGEAGGSWIGTDSKGRTGCLMNGAFKPHVRELPYRKSRGKVFLDAFGALDVIDFLDKYDFKGIEPFTLIWAEPDRLFEVRWDGSSMHRLKMNAGQPHIWASATLYESKWQEKRKEWFSKFLSCNNKVRPADIRKFHKTAGNEFPEYGLLMKRGPILQTVSITTVQVATSESRIFYENLVTAEGNIQQARLDRTNPVN